MLHSRTSCNIILTRRKLKQIFTSHFFFPSTCASDSTRRYYYLHLLLDLLNLQLDLRKCCPCWRKRDVSTVAASAFIAVIVLLHRAAQVQLDNKAKCCSLLESKHHGNDKREESVVIQTKPAGWEFSQHPWFATPCWKRKFNEEHHFEAEKPYFFPLMIIICSVQIGLIVPFPGDLQIQFFWREK